MKSNDHSCIKLEGKWTWENNLKLCMRWDSKRVTENMKIKFKNASARDRREDHRSNRPGRVFLNKNPSASRSEARPTLSRHKDEDLHVLHENDDEQDEVHPDFPEFSRIAQNSKKFTSFKSSCHVDYRSTNISC